ncbi:glucan biosynthesis protein [Sphingobium sp. LMC3-1-1.1]|uniref:glucan biosynthesis protein n=1 Tax=Sphingobium sp. LMC3-1-1.1 TaxID=3135241 RepID=UPI0039C8F255
MNKNISTAIGRRAMIAASGAALLFPGSLLARDGAEAFSWNMLVARAQRLARTAFKVTPFFPGADKIGYDAFNQARFRDERTIWNDRGDDTGIRLFPLSSTVQQPVEIALVEQGRATPLRYDPDMFEAPAGNAVRNLGPDAGFAGFRIMNAAQDGDWLSFLGATYFRAPAERQFGLSARAVAINTSIAGKEEFPRFTHFWLERTGRSSVTVYALMDSASLTGAFRFASTLTPQGVRQDVDAVLFTRKAVAELGLMPMTSMFWYDQADRRTRTDWRPEIHDSDMLSIASADGTVHCRPLVNPSAPRVDVFAERNPKGFGLLQRDRNFDHYQDDGVFYERRPSLWTTSRKPLGAGEVRLYAFPTDSEYTDNVAAYWTPAAPTRAGSRIEASYRLDWSAARAPASAGLATVENIWTGQSGEAGVDRFLVDFAGVPAGTQPDIWVDLAGGTLVKKAGYPVLHQKDMFRMVLDIRRDRGKATDIRALLRTGNRPFSEYVHYPLGA